MDSLSTGSLPGAQKEELMEELKKHFATETFNDFYTKIKEKCFKRCLGKPGTSLDSHDQKCLAMCMDRFIDSWEIVSKGVVRRLQTEN